MENPIQIFDENYAKIQLERKKILESERSQIREPEKKVLTKEERLEIQKQKKDFLDKSGIKKITNTEKQAPVISQRRITEYDAVPIIDDIKNIKTEAEFWYNLFKNPTHYTKYSDKIATKRNRKEFLSVGLRLLAAKLKNRVDALVRLGVYNEDIFGEQNYKLDMILPSITSVYQNIESNQDKKNIDDMKALIYLDEMVTISSTILRTGVNIVRDKVMDPSIKNSSDIGLRR